MGRRFGWWMAIGWTLVSSAVAHATVLYMGIPEGRTIAYATTDSGWARVEWADLPDVGASAAPAAADVDGDGDADLFVGSSAGTVIAYTNTGGAGGPVWTRAPQRDVVLDGAEETRPALGDVNHDGKMDLAIGTEHGP